MTETNIITLDTVLEQLRGIADKSIAVESARIESNYLHCTTATGWYLRFYKDSGALDYIAAIEVAPSATWYYGDGPISSALDQLGTVGGELRDVLYAAAGATLPANPSIGVHTAATEIHPLPWTISPIDAGDDLVKYEINDANNFVVCLVDDEPVAQFIVDSVNAK